MLELRLDCSETAKDKTVIKVRFYTKWGEFFEWGCIRFLRVAVLSGVAVLVSRLHTGNWYPLRGSEFAPEVHYFSCAGTHISVSYAFGSHGMCTFYLSGCQSTGSLSVAIARSEGGEVLIGQSQCIAVKKTDLSDICCLFASSVTILHAA